MSPNNAKICIVVTTINTGEFLDDYCTQADAEGVRDRLRVVVIPDRKTPRNSGKMRPTREAQIDVLCPTLSEQENYLKKFGKFGSLVPYNSDNRRNIGFLMALEWGYSRSCLN